MAEVGPELSVVCKSCGSEVSPYVTECPYCGTRLRKRAPKLERVGDEVRVREDREGRKRRRRAGRGERKHRSLALGEDLTARPLVTFAALLVPAILVIVERAGGFGVNELGAIVGPVGGDWWRYLAAPFVYDDLGYLFACGLAFVIFLPPIERRIGSIATLLLVLGTGALGMLAAGGLESSLGDGVAVASGGNGIALGALAFFVVIRDAERRADPTEEVDLIGVAVCAAVLLALPLVEDFASLTAGIAGGLVGGACGLAAALGGRTTR